MSNNSDDIANRFYFAQFLACIDALRIRKNFAITNYHAWLSIAQHGYGVTTVRWFAGRTEPSVQCELFMQSVVQILLFSVIAFLVLPICEAARVSLGLSGTPEWLVRDLFGVSIALSTIPSAALALSIVFILPEGLKRLKASEIQSYKNFLKEENFHVSLLEEKADEEVNKIITVANHFGELDKAEVLSSVLLKRHLNAITPPGRVL